MVPVRPIDVAVVVVDQELPVPLEDQQLVHRPDHRLYCAMSALTVDIVADKFLEFGDIHQLVSRICSALKLDCFFLWIKLETNTKM